MFFIYAYLIVGFSLVLLLEGLIVLLNAAEDDSKDWITSEDLGDKEDLMFYLDQYAMTREYQMPMLIFGWLPLIIMNIRKQ